MRNQRFQVNDACSDETNCLWVDIVISILPAEINLFGREMHKRDGLEILADADHEDGAAETGGLCDREIRLLVLRDEDRRTTSLHIFQHGY